MHGDSNMEHIILNPSSSDEPARQHEFITSANVRRIRQRLEQGNIRLADSDGESVVLHNERLQKAGSNVFLKRSCDPSPLGSGLAHNAFVLIIQTKYQQKCFQEWGNSFAGLDAIQNTTCYEGFSLFTLMLRDPWGMGFPAALMFSSNGTDTTINFYLRNLHTWFPNINPHHFMSLLFLCWWHVFHAWQQHFNASKFPELWALLKSWIRITDQVEFDSHWEKIKAVAPESVVAYLTRNWLTLDVVKIWSAVYHQGFPIEEKSNTNMLTKAWHHLLKGHFLQGKRN
jgi:hypothetical protein